MILKEQQQQEQLKNGIDVYWMNISTKTDRGTLHSLLLCFDNEGNWTLLNGIRPIKNDYTIIPENTLGIKFKVNNY